MSDTISVIAASMHADADALRVIGQNIANAESVAYRREISLGRIGFEQASQEVAEASSTEASALNTAIDLRPGTLKSTAEPFDLAIEGQGFFVVSTEQGEALTRRGDFRQDAQGNLVTQAGHAVLGERGVIKLGATAPSITPDGVIHAGDQVIDRLRIVDVDDTAALRSAGDGTFVLAAGSEARATATSRIQQGFLETSNVQSTNEMMQLMETMRRFEAAQRFVRGYDEMVDKAISTLGKI